MVLFLIATYSSTSSISSSLRNPSKSSISSVGILARTAMKSLQGSLQSSSILKSLRCIRECRNAAWKSMPQPPILRCRSESMQRTVALESLRTNVPKAVSEDSEEDVSVSWDSDGILIWRCSRRRVWEFEKKSWTSTFGILRLSSRNRCIWFFNSCKIGPAEERALGLDEDSMRTDNGHCFDRRSISCTHSSWSSTDTNMVVHSVGELIAMSLHAWQTYVRPIQRLAWRLAHPQSYGGVPMKLSRTWQKVIEKISGKRREMGACWFCFRFSLTARSASWWLIERCPGPAWVAFISVYEKKSWT